MKIIELHFPFQVRGGKNNMKVSKYGHHYPDKKFVEWRSRAMDCVAKQKPPNFITIVSPTLRWFFNYIPSDNRRRDAPAILDAVMHVLERSGVVEDDSCIKQIQFNTLPVNKDLPGIWIRVEEI